MLVDVGEESLVGDGEQGDEQRLWDSQGGRIIGMEDGWWEAGGEDIDFEHFRRGVGVGEDGDELVVLRCCGGI